MTDAGNQEHPSEKPDRRSRVTPSRRLQAAKARFGSQKAWMVELADRVTRLASSRGFLLFHVAWFTLWIIWNTTGASPNPFDPYPFGLLTMIVSLEAIALSIIILMSQGREAAIAEMREEVALEVNLRVEEEVTKALQLIIGLYRRLNFPLAEDPELAVMLHPLDRDEIERDLSAQIGVL